MKKTVCPFWPFTIVFEEAVHYLAVNKSKQLLFFMLQNIYKNNLKCLNKLTFRTGLIAP